jgi:hypothetical protein
MDEELLQRKRLTLPVCAGKPRIRGTRIYITIILDAVAEGLTPENIDVKRSMDTGLNMAYTLSNRGPIGVRFARLL